MTGLAIDRQLWERVSRKHVHISLNVKILWVLKKKLKKIIEKKKIDNHAHAQERMPRIYVVRPLAYIHRRERQGESSTNKYGKYKGGMTEFSQNPNPNTPKLLNIKRDIVILQLQQQQSCSPKI